MDRAFPLRCALINARQLSHVVILARCRPMDKQQIDVLDVQSCQARIQGGCCRIEIACVVRDFSWSSTPVHEAFLPPECLHQHLSRVCKSMRCPRDDNLLPARHVQLRMLHRHWFATRPNRFEDERAALCPPRENFASLHGSINNSCIGSFISYMRP